jgi:hypothetical protein
MKLPRSFGSLQSDGSTRAYLEQLSRALDAYTITFGDTTSNTEHLDMDVWKVTGTTPATPNTEFAVPHQLLRVPWGYIVAGKSISGDFYTSTGGSAWTAATASAAGNIFLKCSVASVGFVLIII